MGNDWSCGRGQGSEAKDILMHKQENAHVQNEQQGGDLQDPGIRIFLRTARRMAAAIVMAIDAAAAYMRGPAQGQHQAGANDNRQFVPMNALMNFKNKTRHDCDQAQISCKAHDRHDRWQNAAENMAEFRHQHGNRKVAVDSAQSIRTFKQGEKTARSSVIV